MSNRKTESDFIVTDSECISANYSLLTLELPAGDTPPCEVKPGQFVQVRINDCPGVFLRRPISVHDYDPAAARLSLLVRRAGAGTESLCRAKPGDTLNLLWPLGNGFTTDLPAGSRTLLTGGGVGVAPLLYLGRKLLEKGIAPSFLLAARTKDDLLRLDEFERIGKVCVSTDDGSLGQRGLVTANDILRSDFDIIYCCGPMPMMKAVAAICRERAISCEVSLENVMACGIGACLCCVEKTVKGNRCVCTDGPVFNINELTW